MIWKPTTKLGAVALTLAALAVLCFGAIMVSIAAFGGVEVAWVGALLGALYLSAGVGSGVLAVISIFKRHERSFLVPGAHTGSLCNGPGSGRDRILNRLRAHRWSD